jgi:hypothetical protein
VASPPIGGALASGSCHTWGRCGLSEIKQPSLRIRLLLDVTVRLYYETGAFAGIDPGAMGGFQGRHGTSYALRAPCSRHRRRMDQARSAFLQLPHAGYDKAFLQSDAVRTREWIIAANKTRTNPQQPNAGTCWPSCLCQASRLGKGYQPLSDRFEMHQNKRHQGEESHGEFRCRDQRDLMAVRTTMLSLHNTSYVSTRFRTLYVGFRILLT